MATSLDNESELRRRYLLGELSEREQTSLEERYFSNDEAFEQLLATEEELVDDYVRGALSHGQREHLETRLKLSPDGKRKLEFSRALMRVRDPGRVPVRSSPAWWRRQAFIPAALAAAILLITVAAVWMVVERDRARSGQPVAARQPSPEGQQPTAVPPGPQTVESVPAPRQTAEKMPAPQQTAESVAVPRQSQSPVPAPAPMKRSKTSTVLLVASIRGTGTVNRLEIGSDTEWAELRIPLEDDAFRSYRALIRRLDGSLAWRAVSLKPARIGSKKVFTARVPAKALSASEYTVMIEGAAGGGRYEDVAEFYLEVARK